MMHGVVSPAHPNRHPRREGRLGIGAVAIALTCALAGCRGSPAAADAAAAARIREAQASAIAEQAGLGGAVQAFLAQAAGASEVTATVVYDQGGGQSTTVMAEAPNRRIDVVGASGPGSTDRVVVRGADTFVCHLDTTRWSCLSGVDSAPGGPFTPDAVTTTIASLAQLSQTYDFAVGTRPMLGLVARCLTATRRPGQPPVAGVGDRAVICIAPSGVILRVEDGGSALQATSYRESVPRGAFDLPARPTPAVTSTSAALPPAPLP
jgi:hypothetical protein